MDKVEDYLVLNTGTRISIVGLGTWNAHPDKVSQAVEYAISECGYRHIDCAFVYHNEKEIGQGLAKVFRSNAVKREEVFITSKLWNTAHARNNVAAACKNTLRDLGLEYLDLYLMHFGIAIRHGVEDEPLDQNGFVITEKIPLRETWEAMEDLVKTGFVKAIGVSNFTAPMLLDLFSYAKIAPAMNQIELHPYLQQSNLVEFCKYKNILLTAYSPLGSPGALKKEDPILLDDKIIQTIARNHGKSSAQILIRWAIQRNTVAIPKSTMFEHIKTNIEIFDFKLSQEELDSIKTLDRKFRFINPQEWWKIPYFD